MPGGGARPRLWGLAVCAPPAGRSDGTSRRVRDPDVAPDPGQGRASPSGTRSRAGVVTRRSPRLASGLSFAQVARRLSCPWDIRCPEVALLQGHGRGRGWRTQEATRAPSRAPPPRFCNSRAARPGRSERPGGRARTRARVSCGPRGRLAWSPPFLEGARSAPEARHRPTVMRFPQNVCHEGRGPRPPRRRLCFLFLVGRKPETPGPDVACRPGHGQAHVLVPPPTLPPRPRGAGARADDGFSWLMEAHAPVRPAGRGVRPWPESPRSRPAGAGAARLRDRALGGLRTSALGLTPCSKLGPCPASGPGLAFSASATPWAEGRGGEGGKPVCSGHAVGGGRDACPRPGLSPRGHAETPSTCRPVTAISTEGRS